MYVLAYLLSDPFYSFEQGLDDGVRGNWSFEVNSRECPRTIWDRVRQILSPPSHQTYTFRQLRNIFR